MPIDDSVSVDVFDAPPPTTPLRSCLRDRYKMITETEEWGPLWGEWNCNSEQLHANDSNYWYDTNNGYTASYLPVIPPTEYMGQSHTLSVIPLTAYWTATKLCLAPTYLTVFPSFGKGRGGA